MTHAIKLTESTDAKNARLNQEWRTIRRECKILERMDKETEKGFVSKFFVEYDGGEWYCSMLNGQVSRLKRLWNIEK